MPNPFKIDAHVHVFTTDMPLIDNPRHAPTYSFTHEELIATLDANGVDRAVIAAASPWGDYNDYMLAAVRAHPKRAHQGWRYLTADDARTARILFRAIQAPSIREDVLRDHPLLGS